MAVNLSAPNSEDILPVAGIRLAAVKAGIKKNDRDDLVLIEMAKGTSTAAVYTQNAFCAAPVLVAKQHQAATSPRYCLINSGNANAGTGEQGRFNALACCQFVAELGGQAAETVLPFSTGVISQQLAVEKIEKALPQAFEALSAENWFSAAHAIMTTDTVSKAISKQIDIDDAKVTITGIAKGSGMIRPDMATMLSYIATDANVKKSVLDKMLFEAVEQSFNRITVDGDTSTNDACVLMATGQADHQMINDFDSQQGQALFEAVKQISQFLAHAIVRDGEGATKFIEIEVNQGRDQAECKQVAYTIAHSPLVKTAFFASDANLGRILAAIGRSGINDFDLSLISVYLDEVCIVKNGEPAADYQEVMGQKVMARDEITIKVDLNRGQASDTVWTCDFSYDYVKINAEYRT